MHCFSKNSENVRTRRLNASFERLPDTFGVIVVEVGVYSVDSTVYCFISSQFNEFRGIRLCSLIFIFIQIDEISVQHLQSVNYPKLLVASLEQCEASTGSAHFVTHFKLSHLPIYFEVRTSNFEVE